MKLNRLFVKSIVVGIMMVFMGALALPQSLLAGNGFMGGKGKITVDEEPAVDDGNDDGGIPDDVEGPLNDKMSSQGKLFGDLYKILRYQGGETKQVPDVDTDGEPIFNSDGRQILVDGAIAAVGGEPVLSEAYAQYAREVEEGVYELASAPFPSQCVQPVADYSRWGTIDGDTGLDFNRLPLLMTYDATWERTECEVCQLVGNQTIDTATGAFTTPECSDEITDDCLNRFFIPPDETCPEGVLWADLVDEVHFGRLNLSRSPEAVLQAAFDEAINTINSEDTISISRDAAGRLLLKKNVYSETDVDECEIPVLEGTAEKAIDSPLENLALYVKLIKDGHLVTPGDQRAPIDRSERGGIPLWKMLELSDGPSDALRPTVDISKLDGFLGSALVDVAAKEYFTYYECYDVAGAPVDCLCQETSHDEVSTDVACDDVVTRKLLAVNACPDPADNPNADSCQGPWVGITTNDGGRAAGEDFDFAAAFLAAAADKTGQIGVDMVVYVNSILGINKVVGYSEYDADGNPTPDAVDYAASPVYFDFGIDEGVFYDRETTIPDRGNFGAATVLVETTKDSGAWNQTDVQMLGTIGFRNRGVDVSTGAPTNEPATENILGFTQMADDDLSIVEFIHKYQIPGLR